MEELIFGISLGLFIVGSSAVLIGFLSRRERPTGHLGWCRSCRHPVHGETSHCSECGSDLSGPNFAVVEESGLGWACSGKVAAGS